ncbi:MAG: vWA domain-containing protein [Burkholderiaceae bacterium]
MADKFVENIVHFGRLMRRTGLPVGPDRILRAVDVLSLVGIENRDDVRAALACVLIDSQEHRLLFESAFDAFWRNPELLEQLIQQALPDDASPTTKVSSRQHRLAQALQAERQDSAEPPAQALPPEMALGHSGAEQLRQADFESMSPEEFRAAKLLAQTISLPLPPVLSRRRKPARRGRLDMRQTLRGMAHTPELLSARFSAPIVRAPKVVLLIDISGSMERYARLFLHFAHGLTRRDPRTQTFAFGTRLTSLTHALRHRDPDEATARAAQQIADWNSGTRIASTLEQFNRLWARRLLTGNAAVLLVTDGLDRDNIPALGKQAAMLSRFARHLVWLNPLLRYDRFEPKAAGIRALLPHVDRFLPMHNIESLEALGREISGAATKRSGHTRSPERR